MPQVDFVIYFIYFYYIFFLFLFIYINLTIFVDYDFIVQTSYNVNSLKQFTESYDFIITSYNIYYNI